MDVYRRYKDWVRRNGNVLALAETGLSTLTWLLPDRFTDNELSLEAIHTGINLISVLHDSMLNEPSPAAPHGAIELSFALNALQQIQVLVELWGLYNERNGALDSRYDPLIAVEGLKSVVRLAILRTSGCRILANGGATTFDPVLGFSSSTGSRGRFDGPGSEARAREVFAAFAAFRDKHCFSSPLPEQLQQKSEQRKEELEEIKGNEEKTGAGGFETESKKVRFWWNEEQEQQAICGGGTSPALGSNVPPSAEALKDLERRAGLQQAAAARLIIAGELVHILRPLLYVAALRRWGRRSWKPWLLSLGLELASSRLAAAGATASQRAALQAARDPAVIGTALATLYGMQGVRWRRDELDELTRRKLLLLYALLRDPFFSRVTAPAVERWQQRLGRIPLFGRLVDKAVEVLVGAQKYYSYTAGS